MWSALHHDLIVALIPQWIALKRKKNLFVSNRWFMYGLKQFVNRTKKYIFTIE